jgi:O-antigen/teichoic acid export membrane protein
MLVSFAAVFGLLVAAEDLYLAWLLRTPESGWDAFAIVPVLLAVAAVAGAVLVFRGRARGWLVLAVAAALPLAGMLVLAVLFAALGGGLAFWSAVLLLVGPVAALVLALRRPVREWPRSAVANRPPGGRRTAGPAR